jgi:hypothetical protein
MGKRFTSTGIWDKEWFQNCSSKHKLLWKYLYEKCDNAGVWDTNFTLASFQVGEKVTAADLKVFGPMIKLLPCGKYYLKDFCEFQYGVLTPSCRPHIPVINLLKKRKLFKDYLKGINTLEEKEKEKDKDKDKEKDKGKPKKSAAKLPPFSEITDYATQLKKMRGNGATDEDFRRFYKKVADTIGSDGLKKVKTVAKTI